jgi:two-component system response regulator AtoC
MDNRSNGRIGARNRVMIIDDDPQVLQLLGSILTNEGATVIREHDPRLALDRLRSQPVDVLFSDLRMNDCDGLEVIRLARKMQPGLATVIVTAYGSLDTSVDAFRLGAVDYLTKPFRAEQVANALGRAAASLAGGKTRSPDAVAPSRPRPVKTPIRIVAVSPAMKRVVEMSGKVAAASIPVLVSGETGTGQEEVVRLIHSLSPQSGGPLVEVNCEAISEQQIRELLFGSNSTSSSGGDDHRGAIERASGGTLYLREVARLPKWVQAEIVQVFKEQRLPAQTSATPIAVNMRLAASTSQDLDALVQSRQFVEDLYQYLNVAPIHVPPLRTRREDIRPLVTSMLREPECLALLWERRQQLEFSDEAMRLLERYEWPGNIYEVSHLVRRAIIFGSGPKVSAEAVAELLPTASRPAGAEMISVPFEGDLKVMERALVNEVIHRAHGNKSAAARTLGLHQKSLYRILENLPDEANG